MHTASKNIINLAGYRERKKLSSTEDLEKRWEICIATEQCTALEMSITSILSQKDERNKKNSRLMRAISLIDAVRKELEEEINNIDVEI